MYTAWIKIDESLPWIEIKGEYATKQKAKNAAEKVLSNVKIKIARVSRKEKAKALVTVKATP
ncbi:MAG: hypothetical protein Q9M37_10435 [Desulfonauticus sp.]|nr:hypothetical protein [Desulfonauticus sp.]